MSIWGVQRPGGIPTIVTTVGNADVTLTAGSDITGFTPAAPLIAPQYGSWFYVVTVMCTIVMGSSAAVSLVAKLKTATPTTLDTITLPPANLVNNAILAVTFEFVGTKSSTLYYPTGDTPLVTFACGTNNATLKAGSRAIFGFGFGGD